MKVAVTGASGFVGSHVLRALAARGDVEIVAISRVEMAADALPPGSRHVRLDLAETSSDVFSQLGAPDVLIHLAWGGLPNYLSLHHFEVELPLHYRFLRSMVEGGLKSALVTGTCYEYGIQGGPLSEDMAVVPANPYALAKNVLNRQLEFLQSQKPFALTWARLFYMWGPGQASGSIYPLLQAAVERGDTHFAMSKGEQLRDYLPVEEVARYLVALALKRQDLGIVNICSGEPVSIRGLVERWLEENEWHITLQLGHRAYPSYEPLAFWGSDSKLRSLVAAGNLADAH